MPPLTPTDLTLTPKGPRIGAATLGWTHAGTTKYEVLFQRPYDTAWRSLHLANAAAFGAGPYAMEVPLTDEVSYTVRAINAAGEASAKAVPIVSDVDVQGVWFLPFDQNEIVDAEWAWIKTFSPELAADRDGSLINIPSRGEEVNVTSGRVGLFKGAPEGLLEDKHGLTADEWLGRLTRLVCDQNQYRWVWLASKRWLFKCELVGPVTMGPEISGGRAYTFSIGLRELPSGYRL